VWLPELKNPEILAFDESPQVTAKPKRRRRPTRDKPEAESDLCQIKVGSDSKVKWPPLFYDVDGEIIFPRKFFYGDIHTENENVDNQTSAGVAVVVAAADKVVTVACPGNKLELTGEARTQFRCVDDSLVPVSSAGEPVQYSDLSCVKSIEEDLVAGNNTCGPRDQPGKC
jgi:hypothetical protein